MPYTVVVKVYFPMREHGSIHNVPLNAATREALDGCREVDSIFHANVLTAQTLWEHRLPPSDNARLTGGAR